MPITRGADAAAEIATFAGPETLPAGCDALFARATDDLFASRDWYCTVLAHALPAGAAPCFALAAVAGRPVALFPLLSDAGGGMSSLTTPYTCLHRPLLAAEATAAARAAAFAVFGRFCRRWPTVRIDALADDWPALDDLIAGLHAAGLHVSRFAHFGNWHEVLAPPTWPGYLAGRPGQLRETIRRKLARSTRDATARFDLVAGPQDLEPAIAAFEQVYARSWKQPEPFPDFNAALMRAVAPLGLLRLGVLWRGDLPVAAQLWVVEGARATVLKLAHDQTHDAASPGTVLAALTIRHLIEQDGVRALDYGRGDDAYKRGWTGARRQRIGLLIANPRHPRGLAAIGRDALGRARRAMTGR